MTITGKEMDTRNGGTEKAVAERGRAVDAAILAIEKQFGRGSIMKLGSKERQAVDSIPTASGRTTSTTKPAICSSSSTPPAWCARPTTLPGGASR